MRKMTIFFMMFITSYGLYAQTPTTLGNNTGTQGNWGTYIGENAGRDATNSGTRNTFIGVNAGQRNISGDDNSFLGVNAGIFNSSGSSNSFLGHNAGYNNTSGSSNSFFGQEAGTYNSTGYNNSYFGTDAGRANTSGHGNSFFGQEAGLTNTTGRYNTFLGKTSGKLNTSGIYNTFVGMQAGTNNTTASSNSFFGLNSGYANRTGSNNTFVGTSSGRFNVSGRDNTYIGYQAGYNSTGRSNVFIGYRAGFNETGNNKLCIDNLATSSPPLIYGDFGLDLITINGKLGVGEDIPDVSPTVPDIDLFVKGRFAQEFSGNIGGFATNDRWSSLGESFAPPGVPIDNIYGMINTWGDNTLISGVKDGTTGVINWSGPGADLDFDYLNQTYMTITDGGTVGIGQGITNPPGPYLLYVIGEAYATTNWSSSDKRYKKDVKNIKSALDKIEAIDGVSYQFKQEEINDIDFKKTTKGKHYGFIAQELEKVLPELVKKDDSGYYAVNYNGLIPVLVEGMKEQQGIINDLTERVKALEVKSNGASQDEDSNNDNSKSITDAIVLKQNRPNPLNSMTNIEYEIPTEISKARLVISDMNGREINNYPVSGIGTLEFDASKLAKGIYSYSIIANEKNMITRKMIVQ